MKVSHKFLAIIGIFYSGAWEGEIQAFGNRPKREGVKKRKSWSKLLLNVRISICPNSHQFLKGEKLMGSWERMLLRRQWSEFIKESKNLLNSPCLILKSTILGILKPILVLKTFEKFVSWQCPKEHQIQILTKNEKCMKLTFQLTFRLNLTSTWKK